MVIADWHGAESFAHNTNTDSGSYKDNLEAISYLKSTYGGDIVLLPGDMENGEWYEQKWIDKHYPGYTPQEAVLQGGLNCYNTVRTLFTEAGYDDILVAVGDHELGDNGWNPGSNKTLSLPQYRQSFTEALYNDPVTGEFRYSDKIGKVESTPHNTVFEHTSFAHQHKNILFITIDSFVKISDTDFIDKENGIGGEGTVTGDVTDAHLRWFELILIEAQSITGIKHIVVQSHLPILSPVQKVNSSSMSFDRGEDSNFWKLMVYYKVDLYIAGEVHANTATKDADSNLVQIISRGNSLNGFLKVTVTDEILKVVAYSEVGNKRKWNMNYTAHGELTVTKDAALENPTIITSSGVLKLLDISEPLIHFTFEEHVRLYDNPIPGLTNKTSSKPRNIDIRLTKCFESIPNRGEFGRQYDALVANVGHEMNGGISGKAGVFTDESRMSIYSMGPHHGGQVISYAIWFKTSLQNNEMILVHYAKSWGKQSSNTMFTVTLSNGTPIVYASAISHLQPNDTYSLNDGEWHHIAVSMSHRSCLLSEIIIRIDGIAVSTSVNNDLHIFAPGYGRLSLGGLGLSNSLEADYPNWKSFRGLMDNFHLYGRTLTNADLRILMNKSFNISKNYCRHTASDVIRKTVRIAHKNCENKCKHIMSCVAFQSTRISIDKYNCTLFNKPPTIGILSKKSRCGMMTFWSAIE